MPRILSIGQCGYDHGSLSRWLSAEFDAQVVAAHDEADALARLATEPFDLVLVNRIFDANGANGVQLIERWRAAPPRPDLRLMLVSNHPAAQQQAIAAGALPGFGKAELDNPSAGEKLQAALDPSRQET